MAEFKWKLNDAGYSCVAIAGNDLNDGTAQKPYRSLQKAKDAGKSLVFVGPGVYREIPSFGYFTLLCDNVIVDLNTLSGYYVNLGYDSTVNNIKIMNAQNLGVTRFCNSFLKNIINGAAIQGSSILKNVYKNVAYNSGVPISIVASLSLKNCTFNTCYIRFTSSNAGLLAGMIYSIFANSKIEIITALSDPLSNDFNLFFNCTFKFGNDSVYFSQSQIETTYGVSGINAIKAYYNSKFGTTNIFNSSRTDDPLFNNSSIEDYTLQPLSVARHMAYDGTFIGAFDVAYPIYPYANDLGNPNGFYNASKGANLIVANNKISLARNPDGSSVGTGQITSKPIDLGFIYELRTVLASQQIADRNREWIDVNADIDMTAPIYPGTAITVGEYYVVEGYSVTYNSIIYATRTKFLAVIGQTAFTSVDGGYLYLIKETPNRATCEMRFKQTISGTKINADSNVLTDQNWYKVIDASIVWNGLTVPVGDSFQAITGQLDFTTGTTGGVVEIFNTGDIWYELELRAKPMCKRVGNVLTGVIDVGTDGKPLTNGHNEFYTTANIARTSWIIQARYIQYRLTFQNKMLK